jgi:hypothetical protein
MILKPGFSLHRRMTAKSPCCQMLHDAPTDAFDLLEDVSVLVSVALSTSLTKIRINPERLLCCLCHPEFLVASFNYPADLPRQRINRPEKTIKPDPSTIIELNCSLNSTTPNVIPKSNLVYLNGVTADTSPVRIAFIRHE